MEGAGADWGGALGTREGSGGELGRELGAIGETYREHGGAVEREHMVTGRELGANGGSFRAHEGAGGGHEVTREGAGSEWRDVLGT